MSKYISLTAICPVVMPIHPYPKPSVLGYGLLATKVKYLKMADWEKWIFGFTKVQVFFIITIIIFIYALSRITAPIDTQIIERYNDVTNTTYTREYYVVPNYVNQNYLVLGYILLGGLVISFLTKASTTDMISIEEAIQIMDKYLKGRKSITTLSGEIIEVSKYFIDSNFLLPEEVTDEGRIPFRYVLQIRIIDLDENEIYLKGYVHPFKRYIGGFVEMDGALGEKDKCSDCGKEYDIKVLKTEDYKKWQRIKEDFKRD